MVKRTGWKGVIKPKGAKYSRYAPDGKIEYRDGNDGKIYDAQGRIKGVEQNHHHVYGHDSRNEKAGLISIKKIKGEL